VADELASTKAEQERLEKEQPVLAQKFRYYQELRGYVTDLVECLDEKVGSYISITTWGDLGGSGRLIATLISFHSPGMLKLQLSEHTVKMKM
jgi:hypothetical protein